MPEIYDYARDAVEVPDASLDRIANITLTRFNEATRWQQSELIGGKPLRAVLRDCYDQYNGILSARDREIADAIGVDAYVNLTSMKAGLVQSYLLEALVQSNQIPWVIEPTPIPSLSADMEAEAVSQITGMVKQGYRGDLDALISEVKTKYEHAAVDAAKDAADRMERLITDQCVEGGWNNAMYGFASDFTVYPYAVLTGPIPTRRARLTWSNNTLQMKPEVFYEWKNVSPWDFWYSSDSPDTQQGTGVFIRERWNKRQLMDAMKLPSYNARNIELTLKEAGRQDYIYRWMSENPDQPDERLVHWNNCVATVDVLIHYGYFSGRELSSFGITEVNDLDFYNAKITVIGKRTIQVVVQKNPSLNIRPVFTASFYKTHDRIPNFSIAQRIRDVERCYLICLRYLISNAANVSGPVVEADYTRLSKYMSDDDLARIVPNSVYLASSDVPNNNTPALRFYVPPSVMPQYQVMLSYFMDLADRVTNIPAALHGTAVGSGANRTFRGAAMLQGNAVKAIQAAVANIDQYVFSPMGQLLYNYNMVYSADQSIKGDCKISACGATGLMQREINRQNSYEILQMISSAGQQLSQIPWGADVIRWALKNVMQNMGVPKDLFSSQTPAPNSQNPAGAPPDNMPAGVPENMVNLTAGM